MDSRGAAQLALGLSRFLGKDVAFESLSSLDRAAGADNKALGGAFLGFHLRHDDSIVCC